MGKEKRIRVYARVRPLTRREGKADEGVAVKTYADTRKIKIVDHRNALQSTYRFDRVFTPNESNEAVFALTMKDRLNDLLDGINCTLIAYGQTGSGKTHTLMNNGGVTDYTISNLFNRMANDRRHRYEVTCSFVQIYVEKVFDVLGENSKRELAVREHPSKGIHVQCLSEHVVSNAHDAFRLFNKGKSELIKAETELEHYSSRSHSIFQISIHQRKIDGGTMQEERGEKITGHPPALGLNIRNKNSIVSSKIAICDLAGSERYDKTKTVADCSNEKFVSQNEAKYINTSLLQLGNVISALSNPKKKHVPFRNSTLTRLLQECLGSKCMTSFIICVSPSCGEVHETICSLNFGSRAKTITNKVRVYSRRGKHEFLSRKLSSKIFLLEKELLKSSITTMEIETQTQSRDTVYYTRSYISVVKESLELSELLDIFVDDIRKPRKVYKKNYRNSENGFRRPDETYELVTDSARESDYEANEDYIRDKSDKIRDMFTPECENECGIECGNYLVEHDIEVNENANEKETNDEENNVTPNNEDRNNDENDNETLNETKSNEETEYGELQHELHKDTKIFSVFVAATNYISRILQELEEVLADDRHCTQINIITKTFAHCKRRLDSCHEKFVRVGDIDDGRIELHVDDSKVRISDVCSSIKHNIETILLHMGNAVRLVEVVTSKSHAWLGNLCILLDALGNKEESLMQRSNSCYTYYLINVLQLLQVIRLSLAYHSSKSLTGNKTVKTSQVKPLICSTSLEEAAILNDTRSDDIVNIPAIELPRNSRRTPKERIQKYLESDEEIPMQYVCKLNRQPTIRIKPKTTTTWIPKDHPKSDLKSERSSEFGDDDDKTPRGSADSAISSDIVKSKSFRVTRNDTYGMFNEVQLKYEEAVAENKTLTAKIQQLENETSPINERAELKEKINVFNTENENRGKELSRVKAECLRCKWTLEKAEVVLTKGCEEIARLEVFLTDKNDVLQMIQKEIEKLHEKKEEHIEQNKEMEHVRGGIKLFQQIFESCISLSEELLRISSPDGEVTSHPNDDNSFRSINELEAEIYRLLSCNVRYEAVLNDIRNKIKYAVTNTKAIQQEMNLPGNENTTETIENDSHEKETFVKTSTTTTRNECIAKLLEIISSKDDSIPSTLGHDTRSSIDKQFSLLKDIKASLLIKEMLRDKLKLDEKMKTLTERLMQSENELSQNKKKIELFVKQLGQLDLQLSAGVILPREITDNHRKGRSEKVDVVQVPGMYYDKFTLFMNYYTNGMPPPRKTKLVNRETNTENAVQTILVEELDDLRNEIDYYKGKCSELEIQYNNLNKCQEEEDLETTNKSLLCKIEYLKHINAMVEKENLELKQKNEEQKSQMRTLKEENSKIREQVEAAECQSKQMKTKTEITRLQLEKKLSKYRERLEYLETYIDDMMESKNFMMVDELVYKQFDDVSFPLDDYY